MAEHSYENESFTSTNSSTSNSKLDEEEDDEEDEEYWDAEEIDEELTELRQVLEHSRRTVTHMEDSSGGDSLEFEDNEIIKEKLRALRKYAKDLQASYNELLLTFQQLEEAARQKVNTMEGKLSDALERAKDFQERCNLLESQLKEVKDHSIDHVPNRDTSTQSQIAAIENDLSAVLRTITEGVESGVIKLSELQLLTQENPLPLQDVILEGRGQRPYLPQDRTSMTTEPHLTTNTEPHPLTTESPGSVNVSMETNTVKPCPQGSVSMTTDTEPRPLNTESPDSGNIVMDTNAESHTTLRSMSKTTDTKPRPLNTESPDSGNISMDTNTESHTTLRSMSKTTNTKPRPLNTESPDSGNIVMDTNAESHNTLRSISKTTDTKPYPLNTESPDSGNISMDTNTESHTPLRSISKTTDTEPHPLNSQNVKSPLETIPIPTDAEPRPGPVSMTTDTEPHPLNDSQYYTESTDPTTDEPSIILSEETWSDHKQDGSSPSHDACGSPDQLLNEPQSHTKTGSNDHSSPQPDLHTESEKQASQTDSYTGSSEFTTTSSTSRGQPRPSFDDIDTVSSTMTREVPSTVTTPTTATPSSSVIIPVMSSVTTPPTRELSSDYDDRLILNPNHESTRISLSEYEIESPGGRYYDEDGSHDNTLAQILEKDCRIAELETSVQDLQHKLQEYEHLHETTQLTLKDTEKLLEKQKLNGVIANSEELSDTMSRIGQYEDDRNILQAMVDKERQRVTQLEEDRDQATNEIETLRNRVRELTLLARKEPNADTSSEVVSTVDEAEVKEQLLITDTTLASVHDDTQELLHMNQQIQDQCNEAGDKVAMLQQSLKAAKEEANKLQAITARKESELMRVMSAIHATRAKVASLHRSSDPSQVPSDNVQALEWDVTTLQEKWEELCTDLSKHEAAIASLTGRELTLQSELDRRAARILELEALGEAKGLERGLSRNSVSGLQTAVGLIKNEIAHTKREHINANKQMESVYKQLNMSVHALVSQLELLKKQVSSKEKQIGDLQTEQRQIWQLYQLNNDKIKEEEAIKQDREQVLSDLQNELQASQERIEELEQTLTNDQELRKKDLDYQQAMMTDLVNQLQQLTGNEEDVSGLLVVASEPMSLQVRIDQRDKLLQSLQEQTSLIIEQHANLVQQTDERQDLVRDLETKLLTTQTMCDALEQEVADGHKRLAKVQRQLADSEQERLELVEQMETLKDEAENACLGLESALNKNAQLKQHGNDQIDSMKRQVQAYKLHQEHSETKVMELTDAMEDKIEEINSLKGMIEHLETENSRLHISSTRTQTVIEKLMEELDLHGVDADALQRELSDRLVTIETLRLQLDSVESAKRTAEAKAQERLKDVMSLQHLNQELSTANTQLKLKISSNAAEEVYQDRIEMLNEEVDSMKALYEAKSEELDKMKYSHQQLLRKEEGLVQKLEECRRELAVCKKRADELDTLYQSSLMQLSTTQTELDNAKMLHSMMEDQMKEDGLKKTSSKEQISVLRSKIVKLQKQVIDGNSEVERTQNELRNVTEEKRKLLRKLGALEEHYHSLIRTSSQQKLDLDRSQRRGEEQHRLRVSLQHEYDGLTEQVSDWAKTHKSTTDALIQKIREQDNVITSLKAKQKELINDNAHLREDLNQRLSTGQSPVSTRGATRSSPGELPHIQNQYQQMLEKGLASTSALDTSGYSSPAESTDDLDKSYWIKRAGELSVQLQQSSEYWSNKVREQSLKIEKYESK